MTVVGMLHAAVRTNPGRHGSSFRFRGSGVLVGLAATVDGSAGIVVAVADRAMEGTTPMSSKRSV